jgi:hypothetical protein
LKFKLQAAADLERAAAHKTIQWRRSRRLCALEHEINTGDSFAMQQSHECDTRVSTHGSPRSKSVKFMMVVCAIPRKASSVKKP